MLMQRAAAALAASTPRSVFRHSKIASSLANQRCWMSTEVPPAPTSGHPHKPLANAQGSIIYTETDEAPALATYSLYPAVNKIGALVGIDIIPCDISVAGRVLALFPEKLKPDQRVPDNLAYLGELAKTPEANIIKLPNSECEKVWI
ncbi:MAG: hypothetical protein SGARI_003586, partial [Bacillariaceae sp.]